MRQPKAATAVISAALGSALVVTYNQYLKPKHQRIGGMAGKEEPTAEDAVADGNEYTKPIVKNGVFANPWKKWIDPSFFSVIRAFGATKNESNVPSKEELDKTLPIVKPDTTLFDQPPQSGVRLMWIGHATVVAQLDGLTVITDPFFSQRAGPVLGPKRYRKPACSVEELPRIDAVLISHNHYDHLDHASVVALNKRFGAELKWFVPMGLKRWLTDAGCESVVEMTWWEEREVEGSQGASLRVACTPCQHWCQRGALDRNKVLWSSWCVLGPIHSFHFAGDSGYCEGFKQIGRKYGPFTAAAIPIGAYHPRWFMSPQHVDPAQAVDVHTDIRCKHSIGIHWGTFVLTYEPYLEPRELLKSEIEKRQLSPAAFVTVDHGAITTFGADDFDKMD